MPNNKDIKQMKFGEVMILFAILITFCYVFYKVGYVYDRDNKMYYIKSELQKQGIELDLKKIK